MLTCIAAACHSLSLIFPEGFTLARKKIFVDLVYGAILLFHVECCHHTHVELESLHLPVLLCLELLAGAPGSGGKC